jgi:Ca2+-binding RTX toxin-like protein
MIDGAHPLTIFYGAVYFGTLEFGRSDGWGTPGYLRALSDVNGDGRADIVAFGQGGSLVALGQSNGTFAAAQYGTNEFGSDQGWGFDIYQRSLADVNGDGRADIVAFGSLGTLVALGQSAGTFESAIWASSEFGNDNGWGLASFDRRVADVNEDGMADVIGFGQGGVMVALGTGNGTFTTATLATEQFSLDSGWNAEQHLRLVQDIDRDGRADIIGFGEAATYVALGQADGTFATAYVATGQFTTNGGWANDTFERQIADVNGDGLADIVGFGENGTEVSLGDNRHNYQVVDDSIRGTSLTDWIDGDVGSYELHGLEGDDFLFGKHGNDALFGGAGNDFIAGGAHNDTLISGAGNDILIGGSDSDVFHFTAETGHNSILDFQNSVDSLEFGLGFHFDHLQIQSHVNSVVLSFSNIEGFSIALQDISFVYINANNFM